MKAKCRFTENVLFLYSKEQMISTDEKLQKLFTYGTLLFSVQMCCFYVRWGTGEGMEFTVF